MARRQVTRDVVLFRVDRSGEFKGEVTAVFPKIKADHSGSVTCYAHVGQHGACSRTWFNQRTRAAKPREYKRLATELRNIGYKLKVGKRWPTR